VQFRIAPFLLRSFSKEKRTSKNRIEWTKRGNHSSIWKRQVIMSACACLGAIMRHLRAQALKQWDRCSLIVGIRAAFFLSDGNSFPSLLSPDLGPVSMRTSMMSG